jgi:hypothetical protein
MALLGDLDFELEQSTWQHWIVGVERIGRLCLPAGARRTLSNHGPVRAVSRDHIMVLRHSDLGASLPIDGRGRLFLPTWFRGTVRSSGAVLVAARSTESPAVVLAPTGILDLLLSRVAFEVE